mmetsp:Transcript_561/g.570  ORF Transcript_561/g.570 Transcript_561/m.570 type:complete len:282 (+) Transcript_561:313-1158(+)
MDNLDQKSNIEHKKYGLPNKLLLRIYFYNAILNSSQYFKNSTKNYYLPSFIHIPKTGGQSIENSLLKHRILVGRYAFGLMFRNITIGSRRRIYPIQIDNVLENINVPSICNFWHMPPARFVERSLTVVRDPMERLLSAYCYQYLSRIQSYNPSNSSHLHQSELPTCADLNRYINHTYHEYHISQNRRADDCHSLSQWQYAKYAHTILGFKDIRTMQFWQMIASHFQLNPTVLKPVHDPKTSCSIKSFSRLVNTSSTCITSTSRNLLKLHFYDDYLHLSQYF